MSEERDRLVRDLRPREAALAERVFGETLRKQMLAEIGAGDATSTRGGGGEERGGRRRNPRPRTERRPHGVRRPDAGSRLGGGRRPLAIGAIGLAGMLACGALALVVGAGSAVAPTAAEAVSFHEGRDGALIAAVTDPTATRARLDAAFAKRGLHIRVELFPVSPGLVGKVTYMALSSTKGPQIESLPVGDRCRSGVAVCAIGLKIPAGFKATARIGLGRAARPGEAYASSVSAFGQGEALYCSGLLGAQVAQAMPVLERDKLEVRWMEDVEVKSAHGGVSSRALVQANAPVGNYIWSATATAQGHVTIQTEPKPGPPPGASAPTC